MQIVKNKKLIVNVPSTWLLGNRHHTLKLKTKFTKQIILVMARVKYFLLSTKSTHQPQIKTNNIQMAARHIYLNTISRTRLKQIHVSKIPSAATKETY